jgi:hypothetical protein
LLPAQQQQVLEVTQQHMQQHQQFLEQMAQGQGAPGRQKPAGRIPGVRERSGSEGGIVSLVRSQAQEMSQEVQRAPGQN